MVGTAEGAAKARAARRAHVTQGKRLRNLYDAAVQRQIADEAAARTHRAIDPVERAKTFLRRKGYVCYAAWVIGFRPDMTMVGNRLMTSEDILAFARAKGFIE